MSPLSVSVIIPTYNRPARLAALLESLADQSLPPESFEVIVVDDGSTESYSGIVNSSWSFYLRYFWQNNIGATDSRNNGARVSSGRVLVFIDDDILLYPTTLQFLVQEVEKQEQTIVLGTLIEPKPNREQILKNKDNANPQECLIEHVHFSHCMSGLLAIRRDDFFLLGGFRDPTGGWPNWDDIDFGYRAFLQGFQIIRLTGACAEHWDYTSADFDAACRRWELASESAARLFHRYPELFPEIPMFHDKVPIDWSNDSPSLVGRKAARIVTSSQPAVLALRAASRMTEILFSDSVLSHYLSRWITGAYIFRGYRRGLKELKSLTTFFSPAAKNS